MMSEFHPKTYGIPSSWVEDFYAPLQDFSFSRVGNLEGKRVLELGCGPGSLTVMLAKKGCFVEGTDKDSEKVRETERLAEDLGVGERVNAQMMDIERLDYGDNLFDIVFSRSVLMYVDPDRVVSEVSRVLKKDGIAIFLDNLRWHPLIFLYRRLVSKNYEEKACPERSRRINHLSLKDLGSISSHFRRANHGEYYLVSPLSLLWLKIFRSERLFRKSLKRWSQVDKLLLEKLPFLRRFAWMTAIICYK